jgi:hypothetical protein
MSLLGTQAERDERAEHGGYYYDSCELHREGSMDPEHRETEAFVGEFRAVKHLRPWWERSAWRKCLFLMAVVAVMSLAGYMVAHFSGWERDTRAKLRVIMSHKHDAVHFNYTAESRIYPEDPDTMVLTNREGGITLVNVSDPSAPRIGKNFRRACVHVEGQSRLGDSFAVLDIGSGVLHVFNVSGNVYNFNSPIASIEVTPQGPTLHGLHVKLYKPAQSETVVALISLGWGGEHWQPQEGYLVSVDVTAPKDPVILQSLKLPGIKNVEGVLVVGDTVAYVGGFHSTVFSAVDVSDPVRMAVIKSEEDPAYVQMVAAQWNSPSLSSYDGDTPPRNGERRGGKRETEVGKVVTGQDVVYVASFAKEEGGLLVFNVSDPAHFYEADRYV